MNSPATSRRTPENHPLDDVTVSHTTTASHAISSNSVFHDPVVSDVIYLDSHFGHTHLTGPPSQGNEPTYTAAGPEEAEEMNKLSETASLQPVHTSTVSVPVALAHPAQPPPLSVTSSQGGAEDERRAWPNASSPHHDEQGQGQDEEKQQQQQQKQVSSSPSSTPDYPALNEGDHQGEEPTPESYHPDIKWWALSLGHVFELVQLTNPLVGVESAMTTWHRQSLGDNLIPIKDGPSWITILASQFMNAITIVLTMVIIISAVFKDWPEFVVVTFLLFFNALLGFYQEYGAARSLAGLREMTAGVAKVMRDGAPQIIFVDEVVVGDVVILEQGASVPADARLFECNGLEVDEALLTGEALPVVKHTHVIPDPTNRLSLGDRKNMVYRNTTITCGRGKAVVTNGGVHTEMGKLAQRLNADSSGGHGGGKTQLMRTLDYMMYFLFACCLVLCVVVFAANKMRYSPSTLSYATAVAIAILPESLSAVVTVAMTVSVKKMAQKRCLVRKLAVLEVLGNVTDICSDKTGTLTENKMVVERAVMGREVFVVTGAPYDMHGDFIPQADDESTHSCSNSYGCAAASWSGEVHPTTTTTTDAPDGRAPAPLTHPSSEPFHMSHRYEQHAYLFEFLRCAALCSSTVLQVSEEDMDSLSGTGNPTEIAIQVMTWKAHLNRDDFQNEGWICVCEYAFDSTIKRMSAAWHNEQTGEVYLCTKGAPERVLQLCSHRLAYSEEEEEKEENKADDSNHNNSDNHNDNDKTRSLGRRRQIMPLTTDDHAFIERHIKQLAAKGLRTICFATNPRASHDFAVPADGASFDDVYPRELVESGLVYLGLVGIHDPPRPESRPSVLACQNAGICVRMLTGDHTDTAGSIASMLHIIRRRSLTDPLKLQYGPDFDNTPDSVVDGWADLPVVVGRCSPESKVRMIEALHRRKRVVAMTGDGFNDSPSIKIADVGCAMGSGVDVTKGVADLVITDDNFATIVKAVAEGRRISQCIRKFVVHLLSSNVAEVIALICGLPIRHEDASLFVLSPIEILWLNMCTSTPPATGLSLDNATDDILEVPPNTSGFFTTELILDTFVYGFWLGIVTLMGFVVVLYGFHHGPTGTDCNSYHGEGCLEIWGARSTAFGILYFGLLLHAYTVRHPRQSIFRMAWFDNRWICGSLILGTILFFPIVYVIPIAHNLFVHHPITWQWGCSLCASLSSCSQVRCTN